MREARAFFEVVLIDSMDASRGKIVVHNSDIQEQLKHTYKHNCKHIQQY